MPVYVKTPGSVLEYCVVKIRPDVGWDIRSILLDYSPLIQPSCWCFERINGGDYWALHFVGLSDDFNMILLKMHQKGLLRTDNCNDQPGEGFAAPIG